MFVHRKVSQFERVLVKTDFLFLNWTLKAASSLEVLLAQSGAHLEDPLNLLHQQRHPGEHCQDHDHHNPHRSPHL